MLALQDLTVECNQSAIPLRSDPCDLNFRKNSTYPRIYAGQV